MTLIFLAYNFISFLDFINIASKKPHEKYASKRRSNQKERKKD